MKSEFEEVLESEKKKTRSLKKRTQPEEPLVECAAAAAANNANRPVKEREKELGTSSLDMGKIPLSSFPIVDSETEKR